MGPIVGLLIVIALALVLLEVAIAAGLLGLIALILLVLSLLGRICATGTPRPSPS